MEKFTEMWENLRAGWASSLVLHLESFEARDLACESSWAFVWTLLEWKYHIYWEWPYFRMLSWRYYHTRRRCCGKDVQRKEGSVVSDMNLGQSEPPPLLSLLKLFCRPLLTDIELKGTILKIAANAITAQVNCFPGFAEVNVTSTFTLHATRRMSGTGRHGKYQSCSYQLGYGLEV